MDAKITVGFPQVNEFESIYRLRVDAEIERPFLRELLGLMKKYNEES